MILPPGLLFGAVLGASVGAPFGGSLGAHPMLRVSDSVPTLNVEQVCQGIAQQGGVTFHDSAIGEEKKNCLDSEQSVRDQIVKEWSTFTGPDKAACTNESRMGGESSYTELLTCLEMARDVRTMHSDQANERANTPTQATPAAPVSTAPKAKP
jgi:hypothetical protein